MANTAVKTVYRRMQDNEDQTLAVGLVPAALWKAARFQALDNGIPVGELLSQALNLVIKPRYRRGFNGGTTNGR